jgi:5-methyltetrahydrofolate--homocysteine methyltransferase
MKLIQDIFQSVVKGQNNQTKELVQQAVDKGESADEVLSEGLIKGMLEIGEQFGREEVFLPEVLFAARAMKAGMEIIEPVLVGKGTKSRGKAVIGTVKSDAHDIGKNLVAVMLKGGGFEVIDLGVDVSAESFIAAVHAHRPQIVAMSVVLGSCLPSMQATVEGLTEAGFGDQLKILVGGPMVTEGFAGDIGADGYAPDASGAVHKAIELTSAMR